MQKILLHRQALLVVDFFRRLIGLKKLLKEQIDYASNQVIIVSFVQDSKVVCVCFDSLEHGLAELQFLTDSSGNVDSSAQVSKSGVGRSRPDVATVPHVAGCNVESC